MLAMIDIARAARFDTPISVQMHRGNGGHHEPLAAASDIAVSAGVPVEYLRKVLQRLARARLVRSTRGRGGGFGLARPASKITLLQVVEAIEGPVDELSFLSDRLARGQVGRAHPRLREWRKEASDGVRGLLKSRTLEDLM
jgi:Rrf2 family protein